MEDVQELTQMAEFEFDPAVQNYFVELLPQLEIMCKEIDQAGIGVVNGPIKSEEAIVEE